MAKSSWGSERLVRSTRPCPARLWLPRHMASGGPCWARSTSAKFTPQTLLFAQAKSRHTRGLPELTGACTTHYIHTYYAVFTPIIIRDRADSDRFAALLDAAHSFSSEPKRKKENRQPKGGMGGYPLNSFNSHVEEGDGAVRKDRLQPGRRRRARATAPASPRRSGPACSCPRGGGGRAATSRSRRESTALGGLWLRLCLGQEKASTHRRKRI